MSEIDINDIDDLLKAQEIVEYIMEAEAYLDDNAVQLPIVERPLPPGKLEFVEFERAVGNIPPSDTNPCGEETLRPHESWPSRETFGSHTLSPKFDERIVTCIRCLQMHFKVRCRKTGSGHWVCLGCDPHAQN